MALYASPPSNSLPHLHRHHVSITATTSVDTTTASLRQYSNRPLPPTPLQDPTPYHLGSGPSRPAQQAPVIMPYARPSTHRPLSTFYPRLKSSTSLHALHQPAAFASLIACLDWPDVHSLLTTCKILHDININSSLKDVILARFVPGYASCLLTRDLQFYQDIPITIHDLNLLLISQRLALHRYPTHALKILTVLYPSTEDDELRAKLVLLTQAHSRFVLLLQSLVHSSTLSIPHEAEDLSPKSRFSPVQTLRELTFPPPLSYSEPVPSFRSDLTGTTSEHIKHPRHKSAPNSPIAKAHAFNSTQQLDHSRPSADTVSSMISSNNLLTAKKGRKLSIFGKGSLRRPTPPPVEPRALKMYSSTWRKSIYQGPFGDVDEYGHFSPSNQMKQPHRRFASTRTGSSDSSLSNLSPLSLSRSRHSFAGFVEPQATSLHDLILATARTRAPILRVFVPCTNLENESPSIIMCERQLVESGVWDHLSTGDIICNLGYVPPIDDGSSDGDDPSFVGEPVMMRPGSPTLANGGHSNSQRKWLLFNGHFLVPYTPPDLLPLDRPLNLPTPFYYAHIVPAFTNLSYIITQLPVCDDVPQLTLVHSARKIRSPHSPSGYALVKKYVWTARVVRTRTGADGDMGEGWFGEWILEGEGTREGKQLLLDALRGFALGYREWELVKEKSGGGKLWLRLLTI